MRFRLFPFGALLLVCMPAMLVGQTEEPKTATPPAHQGESPTAHIVLLKGVNNSIQLGLQVNGQYAYPFLFTLDQQLENGLTLSSSGLITGNPTNSQDLTRTITVTDSNGAQIKKYNVVLHVADSIIAMLESRATVLPLQPSLGNANPAPHPDGTTPAPADKNAGGSSTLIVDPVYAGGDTVTGVLKTVKSTQGANGAQQSAKNTQQAGDNAQKNGNNPQANPNTAQQNQNNSQPSGSARPQGTTTKQEDAVLMAPEGNPPPPANNITAPGLGAPSNAENSQQTAPNQQNGQANPESNQNSQDGQGQNGQHQQSSPPSQQGGNTGQAGGEPVNINCQSTVVPADQNPCQEQGVVTITNSNETFNHQFNRPFHTGDSITVSSSSGQPQTIHVVPPPRLVGEDMRAIVGYQQAGASSSGFTQDWFLDFYISRPLLFYNQKNKPPEERDVDWRWWGNVRVASFPQPGNQTVAEAVANVGAQVGALKLNQLAQGAEFLTGIEYQPWKSPTLRGFSENTRQMFRLGLIAAGGATGFFSAPSSNAPVFAVPVAGSPQSATFQKDFPGVATPNVAFVSPDIIRFPKQYLAGIRLTTHYIDPTGKPLTSAPAMLAITVGQNQVITGDHLRGVVGRVEAFYSLPFGNRGQTVAGAFSSIYLFGTAQMQLANSKTVPPLALAPVTGVLPSDPSVTLIQLPNTRDEYRIGAGVDLVGLFSSLTGGGAKNAAQTAPKPTTTNSGNSPAPPDKNNPPPN